jgi:hypothetical protein
VHKAVPQRTLPDCGAAFSAAQKGAGVRRPRYVNNFLLYKLIKIIFIFVEAYKVDPQAAKKSCQGAAPCLK